MLYPVTLILFITKISFTVLLQDIFPYAYCTAFSSMHTLSMTKYVYISEECTVSAVLKYVQFFKHVRPCVSLCISVGVLHCVNFVFAKVENRKIF